MERFLALGTFILARGKWGLNLLQKVRNIAMHDIGNRFHPEKIRDSAM